MVQSVAVNALLRTLTAILTLFVLRIVGAQHTCAQANESPIRHQQWQASKIPAPGLPLSLSVNIAKLRQPGMRLSALIVRDGKIMNMPLSDPSLSDLDNLVYKLEVPSPLYELNYQFFLYLPDGGVKSSERFRLRRECVPNIDFSSIKLDPSDTQKIDRAKELAKLSDRLEGDLQRYEAALKLLNQTKQMLEE